MRTSVLCLQELWRERVDRNPWFVCKTTKPSPWQLSKLQTENEGHVVKKRGQSSMASCELLLQIFCKMWHNFDVGSCLKSLVLGKCPTLKPHGLHVNCWPCSLKWALDSLLAVCWLFLHKPGMVYGGTSGNAAVNQSWIRTLKDPVHYKSWNEIWSTLTLLHPSLSKLSSRRETVVQWERERRGRVTPRTDVEETSQGYVTAGWEWQRNEWLGCIWAFHVCEWVQKVESHAYAPIFPVFEE